MIRDIYEPATFAAGFSGAIYVTREMVKEEVAEVEDRFAERLTRLKQLLALVSERQGIAFNPDLPVRYGATHGGFWFINDAQGVPLEWPLKEQSGGIIPDSALGMDR